MVRVVNARGRAFATLALALLTLPSGCGRDDNPRAPARWDLPRQPVGPVPPHLRWRVRGRLDDPHRISWRYSPTASPVATADVLEAMRTAADAWTRTGLVSLVDSEGREEPADITVGWTCRSDGTCPAFAGNLHELAHAGPVERGTWIHLNPAAGFGAGDPRLPASLAHELGHVLGLDHSPDASALMHAEHRGIAAPAAADLEALRSLYEDSYEPAGGSDLAIVRAGERGARMPVAPPVRGLAPPEATAWTVFDTDGDGADELLLWPRDPAAAGAIARIRFRADPTTSAPVLERTEDPWEGLAGGGRTPVFAALPDGARLLVLERTDRRYVALVFDASGAPTGSWPPGRPLRLSAEREDADADQRWDREVPARPAPEEVSADLDGDGVPETVARVLTPR